ncbi:MAG: HD domain-containing phosphohydrolase [Desulfobacteraceae bacterium]|jgi:response regulator RpfG family c-di-GMP phosphodiesterase
MELQHQHTLLFVDDETSILKSLKRLFRKDGYTILIAESAKLGLQKLAEVDGKVSVIISDQRMPEMNGAQFLEKSKAIAPDAIRFLLTGYSDMDAAIDAINKGGINRYLSKPWNDDELRMHVRSALSQYELKLENERLNKLTIEQNRELKQLNETLEQRVAERTQAILLQNKKLEVLNVRLEGSFTETIRLLTSLIETVNSKLGGYMKHTAQIAKEIAQNFNLDDSLATQIETAALLHDIGLLGLSSKMITKDPKLMDSNEIESYREHPVLAALTLQSIEQLRPVAKLILTHHERIDGKGYPNGLKGQNIPLGAKILAVAADYCAVLDLWPKSTKGLMDQAKRYLGANLLNEVELAEISIMQAEIAALRIEFGAGKHYDVDVVNCLINKLNYGKEKPNTVWIEYTCIKEGMTLMEDLRVSDGRLLLSKGTCLNDSAIKAIQNIGERNMLKGKIHVSAD